MAWIRILAIFGYFTISCAEQPDVVNTVQDTIKGQSRLLKPGSYESAIAITLDSGSALTLRLSMVLTGQAADVVGYQPDSTIKLFRVLEDLPTKTAKLTIYQPALEQRRAQIESVYLKMRPVLFRGMDRDVQTQLSQYDENDVPRQLKMVGAGYHLAIQVHSYQLL